MGPFIPDYPNLPQTIQDDFLGKCDDWYRNAQSPNERLSLLNTYASLKSHDLWRYIDRCVPHSPNFPFQPGRMVFEVGNLGGLKNDLYARKDFTNPTRSFWNWLSRGSELWDSRAKDTSLGQLHFKQFTGSWNPTHVEAHIDVQGMNNYNPYRWYKHLFDNPWQDPFKGNQTLMQMPSLRQYLPTQFGPI